MSYAVSIVISGVTASLLIVKRKEYEPSLAGISLTYSFLFPYFLLYFSFNYSFMKVCEPLINDYTPLSPHVPQIPISRLTVAAAVKLYSREMWQSLRRCSGVRCSGLDRHRRRDGDVCNVAHLGPRRLSFKFRLVLADAAPRWPKAGTTRATLAQDARMSGSTLCGYLSG